MGRFPRSEILATNVLNQLSFSCERMAGFGVNKTCVHQNPLIFSSATACLIVLFQSTVHIVHPQVVGIGARRLRRFTVAPSTALAEFQPSRQNHAEAA
jgi:hypothetical protein